MNMTTNTLNTQNDPNNANKLISTSTRKYGNTTYTIRSYASNISSETVIDKLVRLIKTDMELNLIG